jgi:hypothetical protein
MRRALVVLGCGMLFACTVTRQDATGPAEAAGPPAAGAVKEQSRPTSPREGVVGPAAAAQRSAHGAFHFSEFRRYGWTGPDGINPIITEAVFVGDVTGDGRDDIVGRSADNLIAVIPQRSDGALSDPVLYPLRSGYANNQLTTLLADFNHDGVKDVATFVNVEQGRARGVALLLSDGRGGLDFTTAALAGEEIDTRFDTVQSDAAAMDYDGDGHLDMLTGVSFVDADGRCGGSHAPCPSESYLQVHFGNGRAFPRTSLIPSGMLKSLEAFALLDVNGDGWEDQVYVGRAQDTDERGTIHVKYRLPNGRWSGPQYLVQGPRGAGLGRSQVFADFNRDGLVDIVQTNQPGFGPELRFQLSAGRFSDPSYLGQRNGGAQPLTAIAADFDGNGYPDLIQRQILWRPGAIFGEPGLSVYWNAAGLPAMDEAFKSLVQDLNFGNNPYYFATGDVNGDGCTDLVLAAYHNILVALGQGCVKPLRRTGGRLPPRLRG